MLTKVILSIGETSQVTHQSCSPKLTPNLQCFAGCSGLPHNSGMVNWGMVTGRRKFMPLCQCEASI